MFEPWSVLLASREGARQSGPAAAARTGGETSQDGRDPLAATLRRAASVSAADRIGAVTAGPVDLRQQQILSGLKDGNIFVQPIHKGTAHEVLLALLWLESRVSAATPVLFLPADHTVKDEDVMTSALTTMIEWIADDPGPVYLLGAVPQGPHDQLGYIVPWHDAIFMPTGVYEFVERPDVRRARMLINAGGLWNTFIFGGSVSSLLNLFRTRFDAAIADLRAALQSERMDLELAAVYERLTPLDFSQDLLATQIDNLKVLRLLSCGWWPLKSPTPNQPAPVREPLRAKW